MAANHTPRTTIVSGSDVSLEAITAFARRTYGAHAHQATSIYYRWCYTENPNYIDGPGHAVVAVTDTGEVVGTVNRLMMTWNVRGTVMAIPAIGDLAVDEDQRKGGLGLRMILQCVRNTQHAFVNGSNPNSSPLFRGLKYQELTGAFWGFRVHAPLRAAWRTGLYRAFGKTPKDHTLFTERDLGAYAATAEPDDDLLERLASFFNDAPADIKLHWTAKNLRWRFFHPEGPKHLLIHATDHDGTLSAAMLLSAGIRQGMYISRLIAHRCLPTASFEGSLRTAINVCRMSGIDVLAAFTFEEHEAMTMRSLGMRKQRRTPATFFFHKRRDDVALFTAPLVQGAASDLGVEGNTH